MAGEMQVQLLLSEVQRQPPFEFYRLHSEDVLIERDRCVQVSDGQHDVIDRIDDDHRMSSFAKWLWRSMSAGRSTSTSRPSRTRTRPAIIVRSTFGIRQNTSAARASCTAPPASGNE